ncbi:hypothetical protein CLOM_g20292 [Closterium sp. NIES-68]|nr:hypothetical protein CLOM_g20292 [Closterium sp. NIES-68]
MDRHTFYLCLSLSLLILASSPHFTPRAAAQYSGRLAYLRIAEVLKSKGYSIALDGLGISGLNDTLIKLLPTRNVTILVPTNGAWYKLTAAPWKGLKKTPDKLRQILAYHTLRTRMRYVEIKDLKAGTAVPTLDYEFTMARLKDTRAIMGAKGARAGASIVDPNVYTDPRVIVHGVNMVILPPKLY